MTHSKLMIGIAGSVYDNQGNRLGSASAGKDAVGSFITDMVQNASTFAFAEPVKHAAMLIDPIITSNATTGKLIRLSKIVYELGWDCAKREYPEIRRVLQRVGTDAGWQLHQNPNLWVDLTDSHITNMSKGCPDPMIPVITDVRFTHEAEYIRGEGGQIIDVMRVLPTTEAVETYQQRHPHNIASSETEVLASDYTIVNNGDLDDLRARVKHYLEHNRYGQAVNAHR